MRATLAAPVRMHGSDAFIYSEAVLARRKAAFGVTALEAETPTGASTGCLDTLAHDRDSLSKPTESLEPLVRSMTRCPLRHTARPLTFEMQTCLSP